MEEPPGEGWRGALPEAIGPYRITGVLGRGGMGILFRGEHVHSGERVAVKTIHKRGEAVLAGIRREIHALSRIQHPGIVRILDDGVSGGLPWYAMELLIGRTLRDFLAPARSLLTSGIVQATGSMSGEPTATTGHSCLLPSHCLPVRRVPGRAAGRAQLLAIIRDLCSPLAHLHAAGIVHRDLKPENTFIRNDGTPVLVDLGIAARFGGSQGREELDAAGGRLGTIAYMAPEQIRGELVDARADLYALGCILYECVTGEPPFSGAAPSAIRDAHLRKRPLPPSQVTDAVPPELDRLVLQLLEKQPEDRLGYAEDVARALDALRTQNVPDAGDSSGYPSVQEYLFRPSFIGREDPLRELGDAIRRVTNNGRGGILYVGGESGVGKTRLAMEAVREATLQDACVILGKCSALGVGALAESADAPLQAFAPLLLAVSDHCRAQGAAETARVLGHRGKLLGAYQSALLELPEVGSLPDPAPLDPHAARGRVLSALMDVLFAFGEIRPLVVVIDDLQWADDLTMGFLRKFSEIDASDRSILIVGTYRVDEAPGDLASIVGALNVQRIELGRFGVGDVGAMVQGMLAMRQSPKPFVEFLYKQSSGNPFFIVEYLRVAIAEGMLKRNRGGRWQLGASEDAFESLEALLPLPTTLAKLIEQRLIRLTPNAQDVAIAAAVLGRETASDIIGHVASLPDEETVYALDELLLRQVLEQTPGGRVRFAHDKLREVAYASVPPERLIQLHARAAAAIESRWNAKEEGRERWSQLGHHFAGAKKAQPAAKYLKLAGDDARATYANGDAIRLYREAIQQLHQVRLMNSEDASSLSMLLEVQEALGDMLALSGLRDAARVAYQEALDTSSDEESPLRRARLNRKLGKTWETEDRQDDALRYYEVAQTALGPDATIMPAEKREEWIQIQNDRMFVYYWINRVAEMQEISDALRPLIDAHASPSQRVRFFHGLFQLHTRRDRYAVSEEALEFARVAHQVCVDNPRCPEAPMAQFIYGFALLLHLSLGPAETQLQGALVAAKRDGNTAHQARSLTYLTLVARMRRETAEVESRAAQSAQISAAARVREYAAAAHANQAWVSLRSDRLDLALENARRAMHIWRSHTGVFPFQWMALLPLLEAALLRGEIQEAVSCARELMLPSQQCLPGQASDALVRADRNWQSGDGDGTRLALAFALKHLRGTKYW